MVAFRPEDNVYRVTKADLEISGRKYCVSSFTVTLRQNAIPVIRFIVDPVHTPEDSMDEASVPSIQYLVEISRQLQTEAANLSEVSFSFAAVSEADPDLQVFSFEKWRCTSAGIVGYAAQGNFSVALEAQHPVVLADKASANLFGLLDRLESVPSFTRENLLQAYVAALNDYIDATTIGSAASGLGGGDLQRKLGGAGAAVNGLSDNVVWDSESNGWPNVGDGNFKEAIQTAIWGYVIGHMEVSPWEGLVQTICNQWSVCLQPRLGDSPLVLRPFAPWKDEDLMLFDTDVVDFTVPPIDPAPVSGVMVTYNQGTNDGGYSHIGFNDAGGASHAHYVAFVDNQLPGRVLKIGTPSWVTAAIAIASQGGSAYTVLGPNQSDSIDTVSRKGLPVGLAASDLKDKVAKQHFLQSFRQYYGIELKCRLSIRLPVNTLPDRFLLPDSVINFQAEGGDLKIDDVALYRFYVTDVIHTVDVQGETAETRIGGRYVRDPEGIPNSDLQFSQPIPNPLFA